MSFLKKKEKKVEKITYKYEVKVTMPLIVNGLPTYLQIEYFFNMLPYMLKDAFKGNAEVEVKEIVERTN